MLELLIVVLVTGIGFVSGYGVRELISRRKRGLLSAFTRHRQAVIRPAPPPAVNRNGATNGDQAPLRLALATLHGVVFDIFDEAVPNGTRMSTILRTRRFGKGNGGRTRDRTLDLSRVNHNL
jgi:hypothetical protein